MFVEDFKWSSFSEFKDGGFCDITKPCEIAGSKSALLDFICSDNDDQCMDMDQTHLLSEKDVVMMVFQLSGLQNPFEVSNMKKEERDILLHELKKNVHLSGNCHASPELTAI